MIKRPAQAAPNFRDDIAANRARPSGLKPLAAHIRAALLPGILLGLQPGIAIAGPTGGKVVGGAGNIARPNATTTVINQHSHNLAIDWQKFNVNSNELVQFNQPGRNAQALNRIFDQSASQIHGRINANGRVLLMNPNGVIFGPHAHVNVNGLVAAGMKNISVDDFMAGKFKLEALDGADGVVVNQGTLEAAAGGDITLVGKSIRNEGVVVASAGRVNLAAGNKVTLDFDGDGLMRFTVDEAVLENAHALDDQILNAGTLAADGGEVIIAASAAKDVFTNAINNNGIVRAGRIDNSGGKVRLVGLGPRASVLNTGTIDVAATETSTGGYVDITGANIRQAGNIVADAQSDAGTIHLRATDEISIAEAATVSATSTTANGGQVHILGDTVTIERDALVDVAGASGGGTALIGGDVQGVNAAIVNAANTTVEAGARIIADATVNGDGGTVVVWSDGTTKFAGDISARGGSDGGDGGFAEVSGKEHVLVEGFADMRAPAGDAGLFLVDPGTVNICAFAICGTSTGLDTFSDDHINTQLGLGDFTILTSAASTTLGTDEDIVVVDDTVFISWSANLFTLTAGRNITLDGTFNAVGTATFDMNFGTLGAGGTLDMSAATFSLTATNTVTADGGAGADIIIGPDLDVTWTTSAANTGSLGWTVPSTVNIDFTSVSDLQGGSGIDTFNVGHALANGATGNGGNDIFNITADPGAALSGNAGNDTFNVSATLAGGSTLDGGADNDNFVIQSNAITIADTALGGTGTDTVTGFDNTATWNVTGADTVDLIEPGGPTTVASFSGIDVLTGGNMADTFNVNVNWSGSVNGGAGADFFVFADTVTVAGSIDGGADSDTDTIDWAAYTTDRDVTLSGLGASDGFDGDEASITTGSFTNIDALVGRSAGATPNNILRGANVANSWSITGTNIGTLTSGAATIGFTDFETLNGGTMTDAFAINGGTIATIDGVGTASGNTLIGDNATNTWLLTGDNQGSITGGVVTGFSNIGNLTGNADADTFQFTGSHTFAGLIDGQGGSMDEIDWSSYGSARSVVLTGSAANGFAGTETSITGNFEDINIVTGDSSVTGTTGNTLTSYATATAWSLVTAADQGTVVAETRTLNFTDFSNLTGGDGVDTFDLTDVTAGDDVTGNVRGGGGDDVFNLAGGAVGGMVFGGTTLETSGDSVVGPNAANSWAIDAVRGGTLGSVTFRETENVVGGTDDDVFAVTSASADIFVDGNTQTTGDSIDWSGFGASPVIVLDSVVAAAGFGSSSAGGGLSGFADIDIVTGDATAFGSLTGIAAGGVFNLDGIAATTNNYVSTATLVFSDFRTLTGSATMADSFVFAAAGFSSSFVLNGGGSGAGLGTINLSADATGRTYNVTATDTGNIDAMAFSNVGTLTAGGGSDSLNFSTLAAATPVTVDLQTSTAAGAISTGFSGIEDFVGHGANATLQAPDGGSTFNILGANSGDVDGTTTYSGFANLNSGDGGDDFVFGAAAADVSGTITGDATNGGTLDYSGFTGAITVDLGAATATRTGGISNIDAAIGAGGDDILRGDSTANVFDITGADSGNIDGTFSFTDFSFLESGTAGDTFQFNGAAAAISGTITGDATNGGTLDYSMMTGGTALSATVDLSDSSASLVFAGGASGFSNIDAVVGDGANDTLIGGNSGNTFNLTGGDGTDDGNVGGTFSFTDFTDLQAGTGGDTFAFDGGNTLSGSITGDAGASDTFDYSTATGGPLTFTVGGALLRVGSSSNIDVVVGTAGVDILDGTGGDDVFVIDDATGNNDVQIGGLSYLDIETINGNAGMDTYNITGDHVGNLDGGADPDTFNMGLASETPVITGQIDGGPGGGDVLDFLNYGTAVTVTSAGANQGNVSSTADPIVFGGNDYVQVEDVKGVGIQAADGANHDWLITGLNEVTLDVTSMFTDVAFIVGGNMTDNFTVEDDGRLTGSIDGGTGSDFLIADAVTDAAAIFDINSPDAGTITVGSGTLVTNFSNIENLTGSDVDDTFNFNATGTISEIIDGGGSTGADIVDLSATGLGSYTVNIDGAAFGVTNVDQIDGNSTAGIDLAGGVLFTITGSGSGTVNGGTTTGIVFNNWADLTGTTASGDTFDFNGGDISGTIDGLAGADILDFETHDVNVSIVLGGTGSTDGFQSSSITDLGAFDNITEIKGRIAGTVDTLTGINATSSWAIDGTPQYTSTNTLDFSNFENLVGGTNNDTFVLTDTFDFADIDGGLGAPTVVDTLDLSNYSTALNWTINDNGGGFVDTPSTMTFVHFEDFVGGLATDTFTVTADTGFLNLFGVNPGNVDGGGGATNTISFAGRTTAVTVVLDNVANISSITGGGSGSDLLTATSGADMFQTTGPDAGNITGGITLSYSAFESIGGGDAIDAFNVDHDVTGSVSGDAGADVFVLDTAAVTVGTGLFGGADGDTFSIDASVATDIDGEGGDDTIHVDTAGAGGIVLTGDVSGGANNDQFNIGVLTTPPPAGTSNSRIIGRVDGGMGIDTLDYTGTNHAMTADVTGSGADGDNIEFTGATTVIDAIGDDVININTVTDNRLGTLLGPAEDTTWQITGANSGTFQAASAPVATAFNNFQIVGRGFADRFIFFDAGAIAGLSGGAGVVGGGGIDSVEFATGEVSPGGIPVDFTVYGADVGVVHTTAGAGFTVTPPAPGTVANGTLFDGIEAIVGNDGARVMLLLSNWDGSVDGSTGGIEIQFDAGTGQDVVLTGNGTSAGFMGTTALIDDTSAVIGGGATFDNVTGLTNLDAGTTTLTGADLANTWTMTGAAANDGTIATATRSLTFTSFNNLTGGSLADVFNIADGHAGNLTGNAGADEFVYTGTAILTGTINGGADADILDYDSYGSVVTVNIDGAGTPDGFTGSETGAFSITGTFDGIDQILAEAAGGDTLVAPNAVNDWIITGTNVFTLDSGGSGPVGFTNFANLTGGNLTDTFTFTTGNITGNLDAGMGTDTLSFAGNAGAINVVLTAFGTNDGFSGTATNIGGAGGFDNINDLVGGTNTDSLTGLNANSTWTLDGTDYTSTRTLSFTGTGVNAVENLIGGSANDLFNITASRVGDINTGDGTNVVNISGVGTVVTGGFTAGTGNDVFNFSDDALITGAIDGGTGTDAIDWSGSTSTVLFELLGAGSLDGIQGNLTPIVATIGAGFDNIDDFTTNDALSVFVGNNDDTLWSIDGVNSFTITSATFAGISFTNFGGIMAGAGADDFVFTAAGSLGGSIDGGSGVNTLTAPTKGTFPVINGIRLTGTTSGQLGTQDLTLGGGPGSIVFDTLGGTFTNIGTVNGSGETDLFVVDSAAPFAGTLNGGGDSDIIRALDASNTWNLLGAGTGNVGGAGSNDFVSIERVVGGDLDDVFTFSDGAAFDFLNGNAGTDILDYSGTTGPIAVNIATSSATGIAAGQVQGIEGVIGSGAAGDTLTGANNANVWDVSAIEAGNVDGFTFSEIENLVGGTTTDVFDIGGANFVSSINGAGGSDTITQSFASSWLVDTTNGGTTDGVSGTFSNVENLTASGATAALDLDGASITGTFTATTITLNADGTSLTGGDRIDVTGNLAATSGQTINTGGGNFAVRGNLTNTAGYTVVTGGGGALVTGSTTATTLSITGANTNLGTVTTTGAQTYSGATTFNGDITGADLTFNGATTFTGDTLLQSSTDIYDFNGPVRGTGNLNILPTAITDIAIGSGTGPGNIAANQFNEFAGHLIIGAQLTPFDSPAQDAVVEMPPGVTADRIVVDETFLVGGDVTLIGSNIDLNAGISGAPVTGQVTLIAVGDSQGNGGESPGDITGPASGTAVIGGGAAVIVANNGLVNAGNIQLDLGGGELFLAVSADQDEPEFDASSSATSVDFDPTTIAIIASLGLNLQSVQVVFTNPASALTGLQNVQYIDDVLFEDFGLFGVIGTGTALPLSQCEEAEGCAPNISAEELVTVIEALKSEIAAGGENTAALQQDLALFEQYQADLEAFVAAQDEFGDDFGELEDLAEEFDEAPLEEDQQVPELDAPDAPQFAAPEPEPEPEPMEEAFEELEDEFVEEEIPSDEFEDLEEEFEEPGSDFDELDPEIDEFEDLDDEFESLDDEFEELSEGADKATIMHLTQNDAVNEYRGGLVLAGNRRRIVWTGDIVLPATARY